MKKLTKVVLHLDYSNHSHVVAIQQMFEVLHAGSDNPNLEGIEHRTQMAAGMPEKAVKIEDTQKSVGNKAPAETLKSTPKIPTMDEVEKKVTADNKKKPAAKKKVEKEELESNGITIDDIRLLVQRHTEEHRADIKAKLTEFKAPNVTNLDPDKYSEFYDFLTAL